MKKRIGTLKGHPIVDGDINLVRYPEIHYKKLCEEAPKEIFKVKLEWNEDIEAYVGSAIFPVNVISNDEVLGAMLPYISIDNLEESDLFNFYMEDDVIPANVGMLIIGLKEEISFTQTTKKLSLSYPFLGFSVHSDFRFIDICSYDSSIVPIIYSGSNNTFSVIPEDHLLPKNIPIWISKLGNPSELQKLNYMFKDKLNSISKKLKRNEVIIR